MNIVAVKQKRKSVVDYNESLWISTDSEWDAPSKSWISTTFAHADKVIVFLRSDLPADIKTRLETEASKLVDTHLVFCTRDDNTILLLNAMKVWGLDVKEVRLLNYYSPKDFEYAVGWDAFNYAILDGKVWQRNTLSGCIELPGLKVRIKDCSGWLSHGSLASLSTMLGINTDVKNAFTKEDKGHMLDILLDRPEDFLRYSADDAALNMQVVESFVLFFNRIMKECLSMESGFWTVDDVPLTGGSLVAATFQKWIYQQSEMPEVMNFCVRKLGILDRDDKRYKWRLGIFQRVIEKYQTPEQLIPDLESADLVQFGKTKFLSTGLDGCSVKTFASRPLTETTPFNALVQGGRCNNEMPFEYMTTDCVDVDIVGCYGNALRSFTYPIGLPYTWATSNNQHGMTLGEWLVDNKDELSPGLWTATVSGALSFRQDLVYSKVVKLADINKPADDKDINSDMVLPGHEIINGIITHDMLVAIKAIATDKEWKEWQSLRLVTAVAYLKNQECKDIDAWCRVVMKDTGEYAFENDGRSRAWVGIPLESFVGKLVEKRKEYPKKETMNEMLKLVINMIYGVTASRYFVIGNTVVGNNITARARLSVWMMAKALGLRQTITDGGPYRPAEVPIFEGRQPGFNTLATEWYAPNRGRKFTSLPECQKIGQLNEVAKAHMIRFWEPYGLSIPFEIEHKTDPTKTCWDIAVMAYWNKSDYMFLYRNGEIDVKLRGKVKGVTKGKKGRLLHPSFTLLANIIEGNDVFPEDLSFNKSSLFRVNAYKQMMRCPNGYADCRNLRPGDNLPIKTLIARYNNYHFPINTYEEYVKRRDRKKTIRGKRSEWFERHRGHGIKAVHDCMRRNKLR